MKKVGKLVAFNLTLVVLTIILFSKRGLGLGFEPRAGAMKFALSISLAFLGVALFFFVNYEIIIHEETLNFKMTDLTTVNNCILALKQCRKTDPAFRGEIDKTIEQLQILERRKNALTLLFRQNGVEESFEYLNKTAEKANFYVFANVKRIINKLIVFDNEEYDKNPESYNLEEYRGTIRDIIRDNDLILKEYSDMLMALSSIEVATTNHTQEIRDMTEALNKVLKGEQFASLEKEYKEKMEV